jgi:hypothetical protein
MIAGIVVMGMRLSDYMYLSQAAREVGVVLSRTPNMAALGPLGDSSFSISSTASGDSAAATACMQTLSSVGACGENGQNSACSTCAQAVAGWYVQQAFKLKKLISSSDMTVRVRFAAPPSDVNAGATGLCMIFISVSATTKGWLSYLASSISVNQYVPYVGTPVPPAGQNCNN